MLDGTSLAPDGTCPMLDSACDAAVAASAPLPLAQTDLLSGASLTAAAAKTETILEGEMSTSMDTDIEDTNATITTITTTATTTTQVPEFERDGNHRQAPTMQVNYTQGRMSVTVAGEDPTPKEGGEGRWQEARRRMRRRTTGEEAAGGKSVPTSSAASAAAVASVPAPAAAPVKNQAKFVRQVAARLTKAARMPRELPKGDFRVILRPRGGLNVARTAAPLLMEAIFEMVGTTLQESREDAICTNDSQNIIVISTPNEQRAQKYSSISSLRIAGRMHEVFAYAPAPEGTVKGVIRGIPTVYTEQDLQEIIVSEENPTALEAHRIGNTTTVIVAFEGTKVPNTIKFGVAITKCSLYRQHYEVCRCCGRLGHRADVCPYPNTKICFACGASNPGPAHERECNPRCKLCGGAHPTGEAGCKNRYKTPHLVKQRRWERRRAEEVQRQQRQQHAPKLGLADFPQLQQQQQHAPEKGAKMQQPRQSIPRRNAADVNNGREAAAGPAGAKPARKVTAAATATTNATDGSALAAERSTGNAGNRGGSSSGGGGQLQEGITWARTVAGEAAAVPPPLPAPPQPRPQQRQLQQQHQPMAETNEVARLKAQLAQKDRQIQELSAKMDMILNQLQQRQQCQLKQQPSLQLRTQPPQVARRQAPRRAHAREERMQLQEESEPEYAAGLQTAGSTEEKEEEREEEEVMAATKRRNDFTTTEEEEEEEEEEMEDFSPRTKRRVIMLDALECRQQRVEERVDHEEKELEAINQRLAKVEAATADMSTRIAKVEAVTADMSTRIANVESLLQQLLARIPDITHHQQQQQPPQSPQQPLQPQPQPPQQQQVANVTRPTWPEQR